MSEAGMVEKAPLIAETAAGFADRVVAAHRWDADDRTPRWIREALVGRGGGSASSDHAGAACQVAN
jgi:hypothetical protein